MKTTIPALVFAAAAALPAAAAHAQFMDKLKSAVSNAAVNTAVDKAAEVLKAKVQGEDSAAEKAEKSEESGGPFAALAASLTPKAATRAATKAAPKPGCPQSRAKPLPALGARPDDYQPAILWPEDTGCDYYQFSDLKFDAARDAKKAFANASKVPCSDCEGGFGYDSQAHFVLVKGGDYSNKFTEMLIALKPGQSLSWKGQKYNGEITATGAHPIGSYPCRQFHWILKDSKKTIVAEREGLYCEVKGEYAASAKWTEVL